MYYDNHHTRAAMTEYYSHYLFNTFFTKKINISSYGDLLLMLDQLPDSLKPIMGIYLFKAANHYCNSYNYYLQQMSPKAYSYQYHAKGGTRTVTCECADCRANGRGPPPPDGPTIEEIPNDEEIARQKDAANKKENFDRISSTFTKDLKAAAEAQAKKQQQPMPNGAGVGGDQMKKKPTSTTTTSSSSLLDEPVKYTEQSARNSSSLKQETTAKVANGTAAASHNPFSHPAEAKIVFSSSSTNESKREVDSLPKFSQLQSNRSFTAATTESVGDGPITPEWTPKNPRTSPISSATTSTHSKPSTTTTRPASAVSSGTAGSNSSFKIFDDSTFSNFFSDLKLPNGSAKSSLFDCSPAASATSSKATSAASTATTTTVAEQKNDDDDDDDEALFARLKTIEKSPNDPPVYPEVDIPADLVTASRKSKKEEEEDALYIEAKKIREQKKQEADRIESERATFGQNGNKGYGGGGYGGFTKPKYDRFSDPFDDNFDDDSFVEELKPSILDPPVVKKKVEATVMNYKSGCVFCPSAGHLSKNCTVYRDSFARMDRAEVMNRCMKCLVLGHKKESCPNVDKLKCSICDLPHIALMYHCGNNVSFCKKD